MFKSTEGRRPLRTAILLLLVLSTFISAKCPWMKMNPAPDVDKGPPVPAPPDVDNSCWMATASNMLAGAGYGSGTTLQQRAADIYADMVANYTKVNRGWPDAALQWWLGSANNTWTTNPYTVVTVLGHKAMDPWNDQNIPKTIGNELRRCQFVGLCFSWPVSGSIVGSGGHATTAWGDNFSKAKLIINPTLVRISDSDRDTGGDIQVYTYDGYNNPNPGGANEGNGCYFDYSSNHPYIRCLATLCPTDDPSDNKQTQIVIGSYKIHQGKDAAATDLHYKVGTDTRILSYKTDIDWGDNLTPAITESQPQRTSITANWDLSGKPVPYCTWVTITTEFVLPAWNAITYDDVHFTYPKQIEAIRFPAINWEIKSPFIEKAHTIEDVTGGYVIGAFEIVNPEVAENHGIVGEYRFVHQYNYNQSPEQHAFLIAGQRGFYVTNLRFGNSYGLVRKSDLWKFDQWMTRIADRIPLDEKKAELMINWQGRLPYPKGMDIRDVIKYIQEVKQPANKR
jgi:hypothetical protein